jgi:hypothetical protein
MMLRQMVQLHLFVAMEAVALALASGAMAQGVTGPRYPIANTDIAKELVVVGVNVNASQVHIPVGISATVASPKLEFVAAESMKDGQARLELRCAETSECLPFFATLDVNDAARVSAEIRLKAGASATASRPTALQMRAGSGSQTQLRVGSHAVLVIRAGHLDIHLPVMAIDTGAVGQQVRVCTLDRKKVFHGTVTAEGTVTGVME